MSGTVGAEARDPGSYLFVSGARPERFERAAASGADMVILDLEDAVGPGDKDAARESVVAWFSGGGAGIVRINGAESPWFDADLAALEALPGVGVMVPKAEPEALGQVAARLPGRPLTALVETAAGLARLREAAASPGVARLAFGNVDFGADLRIPAGGPALDVARFEIVLASRLAGLPPPVDGVCLSLGDEAVIAAEVAHARSLGFTAKLCIHPKQVGPVRAGFRPAEAELDWARRVLAALDAADGAAVQVDGKMVDRPMIAEARRLLALV